MKPACLANLDILCEDAHGRWEAVDYWGVRITNNGAIAVGEWFDAGTVGDPSEDAKVHAGYRAIPSERGRQGK